MLDGDAYHRTMNHYTTSVYLEGIRNDFGEDRFRDALRSLERHLDYYDSLGRGKHPKLRRLLAALKQTPSGQDLFPNEIDPQGLVEGAGRQVTVNAYERSGEARQACLDKYGFSCVVCGFDFGSFYGDLGDGFIHVHHLVELSSIRREYVIDPIKDLRPVCPNCHAMLHRQRPPFTIEALRARLKKPRG
jgi:5-methylcytosine-specific restriction protein A